VSLFVRMVWQSIVHGAAPRRRPHSGVEIIGFWGLMFIGEDTGDRRDDTWRELVPFLIGKHGSKKSGQDLTFENVSWSTQ
jgi:hypothetical protein